MEGKRQRPDDRHDAASGEDTAVAYERRQPPTSHSPRRRQNFHQINSRTEWAGSRYEPLTAAGQPHRRVAELPHRRDMGRVEWPEARPGLCVDAPDHRPRSKRCHVVCRRGSPQHIRAGGTSTMAPGRDAIAVSPALWSNALESDGRTAIADVKIEILSGPYAGQATDTTRLYKCEATTLPASAARTTSVSTTNIQSRSRKYSMIETMTRVAGVASRMINAACSSACARRF